MPVCQSVVDGHLHLSYRVLRRGCDSNRTERSLAAQALREVHGPSYNLVHSAKPKSMARLAPSRDMNQRAGLGRSI